MNLNSDAASWFICTPASARVRPPPRSIEVLAPDWVMWLDSVAKLVQVLARFDRLMISDSGGFRWIPGFR